MSPMKLTKDELASLKLFGPQTYAICLGREIGRALEAKGLVEWVPPVWGNAANWSITEVGRDLLDRAALSGASK